MKRVLVLITIVLFVNSSSLFGSEQHEPNVQAVVETDGLIAFWDFNHAKSNTWASYHDSGLSGR